jgi:hypothetical protein
MPSIDSRFHLVFKTGLPFWSWWCGPWRLSQVLQEGVWWRAWTCWKGTIALNDHRCSRSFVSNRYVINPKNWNILKDSNLFPVRLTVFEVPKPAWRPCRASGRQGNTKYCVLLSPLLSFDRHLGSCRNLSPCVIKNAKYFFPLLIPKCLKLVFYAIDKGENTVFL